MWLHSAERFLNRTDVKQVIVVVAEEDREEFGRKFGANLAIMGVEVCIGGAERTDSIQNALAKVRDDIDFVAIHDAARPCTGGQVDRPGLRRRGAARRRDPGRSRLPRRSSGRRRASRRLIAETVDRAGLWEAQTPQVFRRDLLNKAYAARTAALTDDAQLVERLGAPVALVEGSPMNLKITTKDDLRLAEQVLKVLPKAKPEGFSHPFAGDDMWR